MRREADTLAIDAMTDHAAIAQHLAALLPRPTGRPLHLLVHGNPGLLSCGQVATALGAITLLSSEGRELHVWVTETRPYLDGARLAAWELSNAGIEHTVLPDTAVAYLLDHEDIDAVLVGAETIAANGDTANVVGSQAVAELACRAQGGHAARAGLRLRACDHHRHRHAGRCRHPRRAAART